MHPKTNSANAIKAKTPLPRPKSATKPLSSFTLKKHIVLVGFMGTGKTTIGKILHQLTGANVIDSDKFIEKQEGQSITTLFETRGEAFFRDLETQFCTSLSTRPPAIIATGGGLVLRPENRVMLKQSGYVFWLDAPVNTIYQRVKNSANRPLLKDKPDLLSFITDTLTLRKPAYQKASHFYINTAHSSLHNCAKKIVSMIR